MPGAERSRATAVIHLDTNALIFGMAPAHPLRMHLAEWRARGARFEVSAMAWAEFLCGPVSLDAVRAWSGVLGGVILPLDRAAAERAAILFNRTGRRSRSLPDCTIAATAILHRAPLMTLNRRDFEPFEADGLQLLDSPS